MRFDLEQFLALTMALGTAGAIGVVVHQNRANAEDPPAQVAEPEQPLPAPAPAAALPVAPAPAAPAVAPVIVPVAPSPELDAASEGLDAVPGPQVESMDW